MNVDTDTIKNFSKNNKWLLTLFLLLMILRFVIFSVYRVDGSSMMNTFQHNDLVIASNFSKVERFDVIVFKVPEQKKRYIKRVIGVPGDAIKYMDNVLYVNGEKMDEPYLTNQITQDLEVDTISEGYFYCLGDNRKNSVDSRKMGLISEDNLLSEVKMIFFPFNKFSTL
ncbi:signal peptidase I [Facklamia sp. 7083-14-GEN3]|uniref:signal peptidase I n=1 Tax=Facklamia sp. 7083-14-GEN3 TaxID=2973478 RepID=UPI00215D24F9|nr:signal peptidase I [Facklamia sp. 7083-14-GEN3]MCR8968618.1 signal peptidase I [Facklamia sp. 7083-14-GEN3]